MKNSQKKVQIKEYLAIINSQPPPLFSLHRRKILGVISVHVISVEGNFLHQTEAVGFAILLVHWHQQLVF